jgi:predicted NACHT family NTPase
MLDFFGQITRDKESIENQIAYKQIAIYDLNSKSWFSKLKSILAKYNLPTSRTSDEKKNTSKRWLTAKLMNFGLKEWWKINHQNQVLP